MVGDLWHLAAGVAYQPLGLDWLTAEPEIMLLEKQLPIEVPMLVAGSNTLPTDGHFYGEKDIELR